MEDRRRVSVTLLKPLYDRVRKIGLSYGLTAGFISAYFDICLEIARRLLEEKQNPILYMRAVLERMPEQMDLLKSHSYMQMRTKEERQEALEKL